MATAAEKKRAAQRAKELLEKRGLNWYDIRIEKAKPMHMGYVTGSMIVTAEVSDNRYGPMGRTRIVVGSLNDLGRT